MNIKYVCNAFSPQMITEDNYILKVKTITEDEFNNIKANTPSAVGHPDTARVLGVEFNRCNVKLNVGDAIAVAQLQNGRLPEGCTSLPEGFYFKYQLFTVCPL